MAQHRDWPKPLARRYELRTTGLMFIIITLLIAIGGINSQNNLLFWLFGMAVGAILFSGIASGSAMMPLRVRWGLPPSVPCDQTASAWFEVSHGGRRAPVYALAVLPDFADAEGSLVESSGVVFEHIAPGDSQTKIAALTGKKRGVARLRLVNVYSTFPFGLFRKGIVFERPTEIVITPSVILPPPDIDDALFGRGALGPVMDKPGQTGETFLGLRAYTPGDHPRMISWARSAALDELVVRTPSTPAPRRCWIELHDSLGQLDEDGFEAAVSGAAALAERWLASGWQVGLDAAWCGSHARMGGGMPHARAIRLELGRLDRDAPPLPARRGALSPGGGRRVVIAAYHTDQQSGSPVLTADQIAAWSAPRPLEAVS